MDVKGYKAFAGSKKEKFYAVKNVCKKARGRKKGIKKKAHAHALKRREKRELLPVETFIKIKSPPKRAAKLSP